MACPSPGHSLLNYLIGWKFAIPANVQHKEEVVRPGERGVYLMKTSKNPL